MGYELNITRKEHWFDREGPIITLQEWNSIIKADPELHSVEGEDVHKYAWIYEDNSDADSAIAGPFWYSNGQIVVKKPNTAALLKMLEISYKLGARVIGDDNEVYAPLDTPEKPTKFTVTYSQEEPTDRSLRFGVTDEW